MASSKMVLLVPDLATRERVRAFAAQAPIEGLQLSVCVATELIDGCVRDTRRALFDGPLAVLARDEHDALLALSAGADESYALASFPFEAGAWTHFVQRTQLRAAARVEAAERLAAVSELEKLCALGRLVAGVAEELSDPLSSALISLELLQIELDPLYNGVARLRALANESEHLTSSQLQAVLGRVRSTPSTATRAHAMLADVTDACEAITQVTRELGLEPHKQDRPEFFDLRRMLDKILRLFERAAGRGMHVERDYAADLPELFAPRTRVAQTLISLLSNALVSVRAVPRDIHRLRIALRADERAITLTLADTGPGPTSEVLEHVFAATANSNGVASSVGLELSVARSTLRGLGGDLLVESLGGEGTTFVAWLPRPRERELRAFDSGIAPKPAVSLSEPETPRCVLVVEPDGQVLGALSRLLRERYEVLLAHDAREAKRLLTGGVRPDALLVATDDPDALALVGWLFAERVDLTRRVLLTSSRNELPDELASLPCLSKPLEPAALYRGLEERFASHLRKVRAAEPKPVRRVAG